MPPNGHYLPANFDVIVSCLNTTAKEVIAENLAFGKTPFSKRQILVLNKPHIIKMIEYPKNNEQKKDKRPISEQSKADEKTNNQSNN